MHLTHQAVNFSRAPLNFARGRQRDIVMTPPPPASGSKDLSEDVMEQIMRESSLGKGSRNGDGQPGAQPAQAEPERHPLANIGKRFQGGLGPWW